jgi:hypothetical protein
VGSIARPADCLVLAPLRGWSWDAVQTLANTREKAACPLLAWLARV